MRNLLDDHSAWEKLSMVHVSLRFAHSVNLFFRFAPCALRTENSPIPPLTQLSKEEKNG